MGHVVRWDGHKWVVKKGRGRYAPVVRSFRRRKDALRYKRLFKTERRKPK